MRNDRFLFNLFQRCKERGKFIYEEVPDMFGPGLSVAEMEYWRIHNALSTALSMDVDIDVSSLKELEEDIVKTMKKRRESIRNAGHSGQRKII